MIKKLLLLSLTFFTAFSIVSAQCGSHHKTKVMSTSQHKDIVDIAAGSDNFSTLVVAVKAAGLVETLKGDGPFTVFAPVNAAFSKLEAGTVEALLKPEAKNDLTKILTYHVVAGSFKAKDVINAFNASGGTFTISTVAGEDLKVSLDNGLVILTDKKGRRAAVTQTDITASNGVIHAIDTVVLP